MSRPPAPSGTPAPVFELALPDARVAFSTRLGGVSEGPYRSLNLGILTDDAREHVLANHARLAETIGCPPGAVALGVQVHGASVREWEGGEADATSAEYPVSELPEVDGHATDRDDIALLVLGADCLPVALAAPGRVAMVHCGWRGLAADVVERAVETFDAPPSAAIGPGIGGCCYEVGPEVLAAFADLEGVIASPRAGAPKPAEGHGLLDLRAVARRKLEQAGVEAIEDVDLCTSCHPELFFSHRRDRGVSGRQCGVVWRIA